MGAHTAYRGGMCRNIRQLHNFEPPATRDEVSAAALQYVRKVSGSTRPSKVNEEAFALAVRDRLTARWNATRHAYERHASRRTCYLSLEYLIGRSLGNALLNLGIRDEAARALDALGLALEEIETLEHDAGLGNGGLGRLAA